jgi:hypothetical protein
VVSNQQRLPQELRYHFILLWSFPRRLLFPLAITASWTSLPSGADCALGLGGGEPGLAAGDADGDEVAEAADDEADEP